MVEQKQFGTTWEKYEIVPLGGFWALCVGTVTDSMGIKKVRIAKGKIKGKVFKDDKKKIKFELADKNDPITQVNRLNINRKSDWEAIKKLVEKYLQELKE